MRHLEFSSIMVWCMGLCLGSQALAFQASGSNWAYVQNPMGENWVICPNSMPDGAVQRTKDGAATWNSENFQFTFAPEACLSNGVYPILNSVNQIDFGALPSGTLAITVRFFFTDTPNQTIECDMRFNSAIRWYAGTNGTPLPDPNLFDWWSVATHEMGHCLGLEHEDQANPPAVMRTVLQIGSVARQLAPDDIAGRNALYSQPRQGVTSTPASPDAPVVPVSPAPTPVPSGGNNGDGSTGGGGGGCSLMPGNSVSAAALLAGLGNMFLPLAALMIIRLWSWRRQR